MPQTVPPNPNAVRRNTRPGVTTLPAEGRKGDAPPWPLALVSPSELELWRELWATPQAVAWERLGWTRIVARYARCSLAAEELNKDAMSEARQLEDRLGLTPKSMRMLMWQVASDEVGEKRAEQKAPAKTARGRIKAVG